MPTILAFGTYDRRKHPRVGILIDGLRANGCRVEEVNQPLGFSTAEHVEILKKPWKLFGFAHRLFSRWRWLKKQAKKWMAANGCPDAVLVGYMGHFDVLLARRVFTGIPIILDHLIFASDTAKDRGAKGLKVKLLRRLDQMALDSSTLVLLDTREHQAMLKDFHFSGQSMVVPVGATQEWYDAGAAASEREQRIIENPSVVFFGLYTPLQGVPVIARALVHCARKGIAPKMTLIGTGQDYAAVKAIAGKLPNVEFREWVEPEELPRVVANSAISLGIFSATPKGQHVVPNKVYESLAAGCAVVTDATAPQKREIGDGAVYVPVDDPQALADAIETLVTDRETLVAARAKAREAAERFTADHIAQPLVEWLKRN